MNKYIFILACSLLAIPCFSQTVAPNTSAYLDQVQGRVKSSTPMVLVVINGHVTNVQLDPTLILNLTTNPPTLSAPVVKPTPLPIPQIDTFQITAAATTLTLGFTPLPNTLACHRNGMYISSGFDFTQSAAVLTFSTTAGSNAPQVGDLFTCAYLH